MFDVGFFELCLVALVALLVFGPERLPEVARSAGLWIGRFRRFIVTVKQDIDRELRLQELQQSIKSDEHHLYQLLEKDVASLDPNKNTLNSTTPPTLLSTSSTSDDTSPSLEKTTTSLELSDTKTLDPALPSNTSMNHDTLPRTGG